MAWRTMFLHTAFSKSHHTGLVCRFVQALVDLCTNLFKHSQISFAATIAPEMQDIHILQLLHYCSMAQYSPTIAYILA